MPRSMLRRLPIVACALALAAPLGLVACGDDEQGIDEPAREGLAIELGGVDYTVFITRELNPALPDDKGYWQGEEAKPGFALYGVFIQACNRSDEDDDLEDGPYTATDDFIVKDTQGNEYEPLEVDDENVFQYHPTELGPGSCIPTKGSLAQLGPTAGAMIPFLFPLEAGENRPLELEIHSGGEEGLVELDL